MGFGQNVASRVREFFAREPEKQAVKVIKGPEYKDKPQMGYGNLLDAYGYTGLAEFLEVGQGVMERFVDYENMEDYPEIAACLAADSMIFTLEHGWISIQELAQSDDDFHVLSYDDDLRSLVPAKASGAVQTFAAGHDRPMVRVVMDNGQSIRCTSDHQFMTKEGGWVQAGDLNPETPLMPDAEVAATSPDLALKHMAVQHILVSDGGNHRVVRVEKLDTREAVYDISVPGYFNFVCNGTVVHNSYDIYADDATQLDFLKKKTIWATAGDQNIEKLLNNLLHKKLRIEDDIWPLARTLSKYGNVYGENLVTNEGVIGVNFLPVPTVRRIQDRRGVLLGFVQDTTGNFQVGIREFADLLMRSQAGQISTMIKGGGEMTAYEDWEVTHWRLSSKHLRSLYGFGVAEPARWIWKRLMLLEDALLIYKLTRAPSRYAFYVDTGGLDQQRALAYVDQVAQRLKRKKFVNPSTGKPDLRYNPLCLSMDTKIPLLDGRIVPLSQLIAEYKAGRQNWTYSIDRKNGNEIVPGKIIWAGGTRKNAKMVEVTLDNGKSERCTPDHEWMLRTGEYVEAQNLKPGDSIMTWKKVTSVRWVDEREDTGTLTIETNHNFALASGVFVKNSYDEDFFIPSRDGKDSTRIDVLSGPDFQSVDDVEYFQSKLFAALKIPKTYLGRMEEAAKAVLCLTGDTKIPLLDGSEMTMRELSDRYGQSDPFWIYSVDESGRIVPGRATNSRVTKRNAEVWEVELDNGEVVRGTSDHPFMMRDGSFKELMALSPGDSLMPLYRRTSSRANGQKLDGYEQLVDPTTNDWMYTHRMVGEAIHGMKNASDAWHHKDFNKKNNLPFNIDSVDSDTHLGIHAEHAERTFGRPDVVRKRELALRNWRSSEELKEHCRANLKAIRSNKDSAFWRWLSSDEHRQLKSRQMTDQWMDVNGKMRTSRTDAWRRRMSAVMYGRLCNGTAPGTKGGKNTRWRSDASLDHLIDIARSYRCRSRAELIKWSGYSQCLIQRVLSDAGLTYADFAREYITGGYKLCVKGNKGIRFGPHRNSHHACAVLNHKVVAVRYVGVEDCYDLTVDKYHNFAVSAGVFVHNSQEDVQFARTIMRVQREICNGIRKTCRVHLAALNIAPSSVEYEIMMSAPSTIFDLARMEVWSARADLADRLKESVPLDWILRRIFQFSEEETVELMQKRDSEKKHDMEVEAEGSVAADKISQAAENPAEAMELMRTRSVSRAKEIMTEGKDIEHYRKLDMKLAKLLSESGEIRQKLAETNLFLQEVRYGLKARHAA